MAISFRSASSAFEAGSTSVLYRAPATVEAGDIALWLATTKYPTSTPDLPTGYTRLTAAEGGDGASPAADAGDVTATVDYLECDGSEDGGTQSRTVSSGNACISRSFSFGRGGSGWAIAGTYGEQATETSSWSVTAVATLDIAAGDYIVVGIHKNGDVDLTHASHALTASGITFGTVEILHGSGSAVGTTKGDDCSMQVVGFPVSSGSGTVTLSYSVSMSGSAGNSAGVVTFTRLRETSAATPVEWTDEIPTLTGYVGESFSVDFTDYLVGTETPFAFSLDAGTWPSWLSFNTTTGVATGTPDAAALTEGLQLLVEDADEVSDLSNVFAIQIDSAPPSADVGYKAISTTSYLSQRHTTVSHSFHHDGAWWTFLRDGSNWNLYEESGNVPGSAGSTVDWVGSPHLSTVSTSSQLSVALDAANDKAYVIGFSGSSGTVQFRELTYAAGAWTTTLSFNLAGTGGVGLGTATTFSDHTKLSIIVDSNGVPLVFAGNKGAGSSASNGCHIAWPDDPGDLDGTWTSHTIDSESTTEGDASGRGWGPVTVSGTDYVGISYTTDATPDKLKLAYRAVQSTVANYGSGWTTITLDDTLSVDNHVWAMPIVHGGSTVILTAIKCGDGAGAGRIYLYTTDVSAGWGSQTTKRHRVSNGPGDAGSLSESPSRPVGIIDETGGRVHVVYHSRDSYQYGFVGYKTATLGALLAAANDGAVFDVSAARNQTPLIFDESIPSTSDAKTPAHPITMAMGYAPVTALVTSGSTTGDSIWWGAVAAAGGGGSHDATGAMSAQSATVSGSAADVATYTSSGALTAQAATAAGTANHVTTHASSGVLEAQAATVAGSANHVVVHGSTGVLEAQAATVSGSADHAAAGAFSATGALTAQVATVAGSAAHLTLHTATGALAADSATAAGAAVHYTLHTATGDLVADAASVSGAALHEGDGAEVAKPFTGAGRPRRTRQRVVVEIDGEDFIANSQEEAQAILDQAKEAAEEKAKLAVERATKARNRPTRKVMADARKALELPAISAPDLGGYAEEISRQIEDIYRSAIQTIEVAALLRKRELEEEDDEDVLMLL